MLYYMSRANKKGNDMFVVYEKETTFIIGKADRNGVARPDHRQTYKTMAAAKAAQTRLFNAWRATGFFNEGIDSPNNPTVRYAIAEINHFYDNVEKRRVRKNMMSGIEYSESVNTPGYMSPASDAYWSM